MFATDEAARWLAVITNVFIPQDEHPGATQVGVVDYTDLQMAAGYGQGEGFYLKGPFPEDTPKQGYQFPMPSAEMLRVGLGGLRHSGGSDITRLSGQDCVRFVEALAEDTNSYGNAPAQTLFNELLSLTKEGYFANPIYLGNYDYAGWRMVGFPGAHACFTDCVGANKRTCQRPMGIAHGPLRHRPPRPVGQEG